MEFRFQGFAGTLLVSTVFVGIKSMISKKLLALDIFYDLSDWFKSFYCFFI